MVTWFNNRLGIFGRNQTPAFGAQTGIVGILARDRIDILCSIGGRDIAAGHIITGTAIIGAVATAIAGCHICAAGLHDNGLIGIDPLDTALALDAVAAHIGCWMIGVDPLILLASAKQQGASQNGQTKCAFNDHAHVSCHPRRKRGKALKPDCRGSSQSALIITPNKAAGEA